MESNNVEIKEYITKVDLHQPPKTGDIQRFKTQWEDMKNTLQLPMPIEVEDIDEAFIDFFKKSITLYDKQNKELPTFHWFSNQIFSEYSQTWEHLDDDGNLLMDFKEVSRDNNLSVGTIIDSYTNIPGNRRYTVAIRSVLEDSGEESYEYYSMQQPTPVNLKYTVSIVSNRYEMINSFYSQLLDLFKAKQCYIRVNNHYVRLQLDSTNDETTYGNTDMRFYKGSASITVYAYLIPRDTLKVEKFPKIKRVSIDKDKPIGKPTVNVFEYNDENRTDISIDFRGNILKTSFDIDFNFQVLSITSLNTRVFKIYVNDNLITEKNTPIYVNDGDTIKVKIVKIEKGKDASLLLRGEKK